MIKVLFTVFGACIFIRGYFSTQGVGPICFSCLNTENPEECRTSVTCSVDQVCSVQEVLGTHGNVHFWSGCEDLGICADLSESSTVQNIIGKRQSHLANNRCIYCCPGDLCNSNCTSFVNLALHKPAFESSVHLHGEASLAVDGNTDRDFFHGSCAHTLYEHYQWWAVDLKNDYHITKVKIYERADVTDGRSLHLKVLVSSTNATALDRTSKLFTECGSYFGLSSEGNTIVIECPKNTVGRWVRIQQNSPNTEILHLCEVEVFGF